MRCIDALLIIAIALPILQSKHLIRHVGLSEVVSQPAHTLFLLRFDFGIGEGNMTIRHRKTGPDSPEHNKVKIGILMDENYTLHRDATTCEQKKQYYSEVRNASFYESQSGTQIYRFNQEIREHLWYVYIFACEQISMGEPEKEAGVSLDITTLNNGSHFGADEDIFWPFVGIAGLWVGLLVKLLLPAVRNLLKNPTTSECFLYIGYLGTGLGIFYRMLNLIVIKLSGDHIAAFDILHSICYNLAEAVIVTLLVSIAWGWSLVHVEYRPEFAVVSVLTSLANIATLILWHLDEDENSHHHYEGLRGLTVVGVRCLVGLVFALGCWKIKLKSVGKRNHFITNFSKLGSVYLLSWPIAVILAELLLPPYLRNQIILLVEQLAHTLMNAYLCYLFSHPDNNYKRVNIKNEETAISEGVLPEYVRR